MEKKVKSQAIILETVVCQLSEMKRAQEERDRAQEELVFQLSEIQLAQKVVLFQLSEMQRAQEERDRALELAINGFSILLNNQEERKSIF